MYTVIVADDEQEIRRSLIRKVDWGSVGFQVIGEAENGAEALELTEKLEPDLLLTDIRMPFISGIELARQVREIRPATQIAFLSGFDDFSYAQQAIQYNIISYLLKPISSSELEKELLKMKELFDISEFAHHGPENLFISLVKIIGAFVFLFFINKKLAFPLIILVIVMFWFSFKQNARMQATFMENRRKIGDVNASLQDTLSGIRVVQSFANEDIEHNKFKKSNEAFLLSKRDNYRCMGSFMSSNLFFQGMMYLVTLVYGGYLIANGEMQTADLAMYALYIGIFISPIQILVELVEMMQKGLSGFRRFLDVMETESEITDAPDARELTDVKGHVSYEHVSFHYSDDNTPVLSDISIDIPAGKSVALVGPSGGGKTTICSLLPRFYDVTEGRITVDGKDIRSLTLKSLRNNIGTVQQDVYLFDGTIRDNIAYGKPGASDEEIIAAAKRASIHDFIMELPQQYDTYVGERGTRLSGGQKQRISIARVFLKNPPILILDEATSALDNESERWIQRSLEELSQNRTTITIAHRLSTIRDADEIIVITEDGIAERGTHEELLDMNGVYAAYYNM